MKFIFDLDGTIVDTHRAVKMAYRKAGIVMPDDAWGKTWREWSCPEDVHAEKARIYPNFVREYGRILPAAELLRITGGRVLTGASLAAVRAVQDILDLDFPIIATECSAEQKLTHLRREKERVMYFDDRKDFGLRALGEVPNLTFAHVAEQDGTYYLYDPAKPGRTLRWALSSWLSYRTSI